MGSVCPLFKGSHVPFVPEHFVHHLWPPASKLETVWNVWDCPEASRNDPIMVPVLIALHNWHAMQFDGVR